MDSLYFDVTVKDAMESGKLDADAGQMVEWDGAWGALKIADVVAVTTTHANKVGGGVFDVTKDAQPIISNAPAATKDDLLIQVTIDTVGGDVALVPGNWYKIVFQEMVAL